MKQIIAVLAVLVALTAGYDVWVHNHPNAKLSLSKTDAPSSRTAGSNPADSFDKSLYSTTDPTSLWVVVNKQHPLEPRDYAPSDLKPVGNGQYMRVAAAKALAQLVAAAKAAGYTITPGSGYRSYATQVSVYSNEVKAFGQSYADTESARPGYSEHQTGWAVDLGSGGCNISDCFDTTPGGKWAIANAYRYGFLLRYPESLSDITGYRHESWHFRYIGTLLSNELHKEHVQTLEQFFNVSGGTTFKS